MHPDTRTQAVPVLVTDRILADRLRIEREASDGAQHDEMWDGIYVMSPLPNNEHLEICAELWLVFRTILRENRAGIAYNGLNVSDRDEGWTQNYREPDVAVFLAGNPAKNCGTHWCGGPDFLVEVLSPNDLSYQKLPFYASIGVREVLIVDRDPWSLELYQREAGVLKLVGFSSIAEPAQLSSATLPIAFRIVPSTPRPHIEVVRDDGASWLV